MRDATKALLSAVENINRFKFDIFNIGCGTGVNLLELANKIIKLTNSESKIVIEDKNKPIKFYYDISKARKSLKFGSSNIDENLNKVIMHVKLSREGI